MEAYERDFLRVARSMATAVGVILGMATGVAAMWGQAPPPAQKSAPAPAAAPARSSAPPQSHTAAPSNAGSGAGGVRGGGSGGGSGQGAGQTSGAAGGRPASGGAAATRPAATGPAVYRSYPSSTAPSNTSPSSTTPSSTVSGPAGGRTTMTPQTTTAPMSRPGSAAGAAGTTTPGGARDGSMRPSEGSMGGQRGPNGFGGAPVGGRSSAGGAGAAPAGNNNMRNGGNASPGMARGGFGGGPGNSMARPAPVGSHERVNPNGDAVRVRANGRPMDVHDARMGVDIHHNLAGGRAVMMERHDGSRMYYERGRPGFIAHPYEFHGREYDRRSYYANGRVYDRFYNHYSYRGAALAVYAPSRYYSPGFYGWASNSWSRPVSYQWGFSNAPWYGYYGGYFTPYPVYDSPSSWLTDYLISQSLAGAYQARMGAQQDQDYVAAGGAPPAPLTPETKQMIADEVRAQVALEMQQGQANSQQEDPDPAASSIASTLSDGREHVFVAGKELDVVVDPDGQECAITDGDVLQLKIPPPAEAKRATLTVVSSKGGVECKNNVSVAVSFEDLQDMQNHMREVVDRGMEELQVKGGKDGLPAAPTGAPVAALVAQNAPPPDPAGAQELAQGAKVVDVAEREVISGSGGGGAPAGVATGAGPQTVTVALGQSVGDVTGAMGQPTKIMNLGAKTVYVYPDVKVTFKGGKVTDVQ